MNLVVIGVSHKNVSMESRGLMNFSEEEGTAFLTFIQEKYGKLEVVLLSTCNRCEIYASAKPPHIHSLKKALIHLLLEYKGLPLSMEDLFYRYSGGEGVKHLFQVASGLDSLILGENQIQGQLKRAYKRSVQQKVTGPVINRLFHRAFEVGKRVRSETEINQGASSFCYGVIEIIQKILGSLRNQTILIVGAGEMGELVLRGLKERGCLNIHLMNRNKEKALRLAQKYEAEVLNYNRLKDILDQMDVVITCTSSKTPLINEQSLQGWIHQRDPRNPLLLIDLSLPRNIEASLCSHASVKLYDLDNLQEVLVSNSLNRQKEAEKAMEIVEEMVEDFCNWICRLSLTPTIHRLRQKISNIMDNELQLQRGKTSLEEFSKLKGFSDQLHRKYMALLVKNLHELQREGKDLESLDLINRLFDLPSTPLEEGLHG